MHVLALSDALAGGRRILGVAGPTSSRAVMDILRRSFPDANLPTEDPDPEKGAMSKWTVNNSLATELLGEEWISMEQAVVDTAKSFGY